jgi:hypothetical protein
MNVLRVRLPVFCIRYLKCSVVLAVLSQDGVVKINLPLLLLFKTLFLLQR